MLARSLPSGWGDSVGNVKIRHYVRKKSGFCYWQPTRRMRDLGFRLVPLGKDGHSAWALAEEWNKKWDAVRRGEAPPLLDLSKLSRDQAALSVWIGRRRVSNLHPNTRMGVPRPVLTE